jgi:phosphoribosylformylglycinamidine synthase
MVGPWQVPVADVRRHLADYDTAARRGHRHGRAHAAGLLDAPASGRMAVGEAITNLPRRCRRLGVKLSANWMAACRPRRRGRALFDTVKAVGMEFCPALGVAIPVGKDSLSMRTQWERRAPRSR